MVAHAARRTRAGGASERAVSPLQHKIRKPRSNDTPPGRVAPSHRGNMTCTCKTCGQQVPVKSTDTQITELVDEEGGAPEHATAPGNRKAEGEGGGQWQPIRGTTDRVDRGTDMCDRGGRHCGHAPPPPFVQRVDYAWHARCGGMERLPHAKSISNVARSQGSGARAKWDAHVLMQWRVHLSCVWLAIGGDGLSALAVLRMLRVNTGLSTIPWFLLKRQLLQCMLRIQ